MSAPVTPVNPTDSTPQSSSPSNPTVTTPNPSGQAKLSQVVGNMADLKTKAPDVYYAMLKGIAVAMMQDMQHHADILKEIIRDGEEEAQGG